MDLALSFPRGIERAVDEIAQKPGALYDAIGLIPATPGAMDGVFLGPNRATFDRQPTRWTTWQGRTIMLACANGGVYQVTSNTGLKDGPFGDARAQKYEHVLALASPGENCRVLVDPASDDPEACPLSLVVREGEISTSSGSGTITLNFTDANIDFPEIPAGYTAAYILFDRDADAGATTARTRPVTSVTGSPITSLQYTGEAPPAGSVYARILYKLTADNSLFQPSGFFTWRQRLCAWTDTDVYFAGYPGGALAEMDPNTYDWTFWNPLNFTTPGHSGFGAIVRCLPVGESVVVLMQKGIAFLRGWPAVDPQTDFQVETVPASETLGAVGYDGACLAVDGQSAFFIGSDSQVYQATPAGITPPLSEGIRKHERLKGLQMIVACNDALLVAALESDAQAVAKEASGNCAGLHHQYPTIWYSNRATGAWGSFQRLHTNQTGSLVPLDSPGNQGGVGSWDVDGKALPAIATGNSIRVVNDPTANNVAVEDFLVCGLVTHPLAANGLLLKSMTGADVLVHDPKTARWPVSAPVEIPVGVSRAKTVRARARARSGQAVVYPAHFREIRSNFISVGLGYCGERLLAGMTYWVGSLTEVTLAASTVVQALDLDAAGEGLGELSRIDILAKNVTALTCTVYENDGGALGDPIAQVDLEAPSNGALSDASPFWYSFDIRVPVSSCFVAINGTGTLYRYSENANVLNAALATLHEGYTLAWRAVSEIGAPAACKKIQGVKLDYRMHGARAW